MLAKAEGEKRQLSADESKAFDALKARSLIWKRKRRAQFLADAERRSLGTPVDKSRADMERQVNVLDAIACQIEQRSATGALTAANLARVQHAIESAPVGSDEHAKLTRLAMALARAVSVHTTATVGRAADMVNAATAEREARADLGDDPLIPRLRAV